MVLLVALFLNSSKAKSEEVQTLTTVRLKNAKRVCAYDCECKFISTQSVSVERSTNLWLHLHNALRCAEVSVFQLGQSGGAEAAAGKCHQPCPQFDCCFVTNSLRKTKSILDSTTSTARKHSKVMMSIHLAHRKVARIMQKHTHSLQMLWFFFGKQRLGRRLFSVRVVV